MKEFKYIIIASHRRSGTHWIIDSLFNNFPNVKHGYLNLDCLLPGSMENMSVSQFSRKIKSKKKVILKTHTPGNFIQFKPYPVLMDFIKNEIIPNSKIVYIYRDGRDVITSLFYYMINSGKINKITFNEFMLSKNDFDITNKDLNRIEFFSNHVESWIHEKDVYKLKYESLHYTYEKSLISLSEYIGLPIINDLMNIKIVEYSRFQRAVRRIFPSLFKTTAVLPRKGKIGDWKNHFNLKSKEIFKKYSNGILVKSGFENDENW